MSKVIKKFLSPLVDAEKAAPRVDRLKSTSSAPKVRHFRGDSRWLDELAKPQTVNKHQKLSSISFSSEASTRGVYATSFSLSLTPKNGNINLSIFSARRDREEKNGKLPADLQTGRLG